MKTITKTFFTILLLLLFSPFLFAQQTELSEANRKYHEQAYIHAAALYQEVVESGVETEELLEKLANSYYFNAVYTKAAKYYAKLFKQNPDQKKILVLRYAQSLKAIGNNEEGDKYFKVYQKTLAEKNSGTNSDINFLALLEANSGKFSIEKLKINSPGRDFGAATNGQGELIFASTRDTGVVRRTFSARDGLSFLDLYRAADPKSSSVAKKLKGKINTRMHEASAVITKDGSTIYFTRSRGEIGNGKNNSSSLGIYRASLIDGKWDNIENLSINSNNFSNAHPALSPDEKFMYFSSDKPGGFGQSDLYKVEIFEDGSMGEPVNLDGMINTIGRETFPFVSAENHLYFSSDGHVGHGGMDVFYWDLLDEQILYPINLGAPLNSLVDDFAFSIDATGNGYVSSNRPNGKGYDDIYSFVQLEPLEKMQPTSLFKKETDEETATPLTDSDKDVSKDKFNKINSLKTDSEKNANKVAAHLVPVQRNSEKKMHPADMKNGDREEQAQENNAQAEQNIFKLFKGDDLSHALGIKVIYFDLNKAIISSEAAVQLDKVSAVMQKYPDVKIEIRSHTDSRASKAYNLNLSKRRAKATMEYLLQKGIASERLSYKGVGETQPVNECTDGKLCSEKQHQQNRRSEFILVAY